MDISVKIPAALAGECGGARRLTVSVPGPATLGDALTALAADHPRLGRRVRDEAGQLRRFVNVYIDDEECRRLQGQATPIGPETTIQILPSIAGG